jgi:hypothetical protein
MSTTLVEISKPLLDGIFTILSGYVTYSGTTYPVYLSIPKPSVEVYVHVHNVVYIENGTKDDFCYEGTVQVEVVDESRMQADDTLAVAILNVVMGLLKPSKASVFSIGSRTLTVFSQGPFNKLIEQSDKGISRSRLIDIFNFILE